MCVSGGGGGGGGGGGEAKRLNEKWFLNVRIIFLIAIFSGRGKGLGKMENVTL